MIGVKSEWMAVLLDESGNTKQVVDWHKNTITNTGLNAFWLSTCFVEEFDSICVGTGTDEPAATDTELTNEVDYAMCDDIPTPTFTVGGSCAADFMATFGVGSAVGSLTEAGLRNSQSDVLWCHNLFTENGSPVVIEKATSDTLIVTVRVTLTTSTTYASGTSPNHKICMTGDGLMHLFDRGISSLTPGKIGTGGTAPSIDDTGIRGDVYGTPCYEPATIGAPSNGEVLVTFDIPALYWAGAGTWREWVPTDEDGNLTAGSFRWVSDGAQTKDNTHSIRFTMKYKLERA